MEPERSFSDFRRMLRCYAATRAGRGQWYGDISDTLLIYQSKGAIKRGSKRVRTVRTWAFLLFFTCQSRIHGETHFLKERFSSHISLIQIQLRGYCSWKYRPQRTQIPKTKNINWPQAFWWASTGQEVLWTLKCQTPCFTESLSGGQLVATCLFLGWIVPPASAAAALRCELPELPTSNSNWC